MIPGSGRFAREEISYPPQYSWASLVAQLVMNMTEIRETWVQSLGWEYQKTSMDCIVHGFTKSQTRLSDFKKEKWLYSCLENAMD